MIWIMYIANQNVEVCGEAGRKNFPDSETGKFVIRKKDSQAIILEKQIKVVPLAIKEEDMYAGNGVKINQKPISMALCYVPTANVFARTFIYNYSDYMEANTRKLITLESYRFGAEKFIQWRPMPIDIEPFPDILDEDEVALMVYTFQTNQMLKLTRRRDDSSESGNSGTQG